MSSSLEGKIAIVTGASRSRGIGAQVAYELAKRGAKVSERALEERTSYNLWSSSSTLANILYRSP